MFRRRKREQVLHRDRVVEFATHRRGPRRALVPRLPRMEIGRGGRHLLAWAAIWAVLLMPAMTDFLNGYATDTVGCRVVGVVDGDTVGLRCPGEPGIQSARVLGYDTPELFSPECTSEMLRAWAAKWHLRRALWLADRIGVSQRGRDRYDRILARLTVDGRDMATRMVGAGLARRYSGGKRQGWCA